MVYYWYFCRHEAKKAAKIAELKKADEEKAAEEAQKKFKEEKLKAAAEVETTGEELPTNEDLVFQIAGVEKKEDVSKVSAESEVSQPKTYSDVEVSEDDEESFQFDRENFLIVTYYHHFLKY